jgi:hypothetical protein
MADLGPALTDLGVRGEDPVHRPLRGEVGALVEERRVHRRWAGVDEPLGVELSEDRLVLLVGQRQRRAAPRAGCRRRLR